MSDFIKRYADAIKKMNSKFSVITEGADAPEPAKGLGLYRYFEENESHEYEKTFEGEDGDIIVKIVVDALEPAELQPCVTMRMPDGAIYRLTDRFSNYKTLYSMFENARDNMYKIEEAESADELMPFLQEDTLGEITQEEKKSLVEDHLASQVFNRWKKEIALDMEELAEYYMSDENNVTFEW